MNDTNWVGLSQQSMQDTCKTEVIRNQTVRTQVILEAENTTASSTNSTPGVTERPNVLPQEIVELEEIISEIQNLCPNNCSWHGQCQTGRLFTMYKLF